MLDADQITKVDTPADINRNSTVGHTVAEALFDAIEGGGAIVSLEAWSLDFPSPDDPIAETRIIVADDVMDYSEKSYRVEGSVFDLDEAVDRETVDVDAFCTPLSNDRIDEDGVDFVPKSAVKAILGR